MKSFFRTKTGLQTLAGLITILSFPLLYIGILGESNILMLIGMVLIICGMLSSPIMKFLKID